MNKVIMGSFFALSSLFFVTLPSQAATIKVTVTNLTNGSVFSPVSSIFHDGSFDNFNLGQTASLGIERLAEDGNRSFLNTNAISSGFVAGSVGTGPITAGVTISGIFSRWKSFCPIAIAK
ncbi:spondin domain-containing protein [Aphanothece sacrum]|uniref:Uncharacterized protein n=1 Tax=Aphanothece sacrum FPU1 TaxID=1920663 RepID=A0A401IEX3_APHSA|nr:spondin domain-containing protein [Aphanothece sacrum]GBF79837.1 hypothetical protein AsFPU1_1237 [Aphanothece sacrum FPU1]GBF84849.1 hypothetical protein AsFPU3_1904 [Aphanothece sacrum FPU3]